MGGKLRQRPSAGKWVGGGRKTRTQLVEGSRVGSLRGEIPSSGLMGGVGQKEGTWTARWARCWTISRGLDLMSREGACPVSRLRVRWKPSPMEPGKVCQTVPPAAGARTSPQDRRGGPGGETWAISPVGHRQGWRGLRAPREGLSTALSLTNLSAPQYESKMGSLKKTPALQPSKEAW